MPGLRRDEVASLAGVSVEYYVRLEQGRTAGVSDSVLDAVGRALRLNDVERTHLGNLVRPTAGEIEIFGHHHDAREARRLVGLAEQDINLDRFLNVDEVLIYHAGFFGITCLHRGRRSADRKRKGRAAGSDRSARCGDCQTKAHGSGRRR